MRYFGFGEQTLSSDLEYAATLRYWGLTNDAYSLLIEVAERVADHPVGTKEEVVVPPQIASYP